MPVELCNPRRGKRSLYSAVCSQDLIFILRQSHAGNRPEDETISTLLLDTCSRLLLALPDLSSNAKLPSVQSLIHPTLSNLDEQAPFSDPSLPDSTFVRLTRLFGSYIPSSSVPNPWELLDHSEPSPVVLGSTSTASTTSLTHRPSLTSQSVTHGYRSAFTNGGPIDLAAFKARVIETVPAVTALDALSTTSSSSTSSVRPPSLASSQDPRGKQTNFDFETPCTGLSVHARDHRRTSSAARMLVQKFDQAANGNLPTAGGNVVAGRKRVNTGESVTSKVTGPSLGTTAGSEAGGGGGGNVSSSSQTGSTSSAAPSTRGTKRKATNPSNSNMEVIVIDDEEEEVQPAKPAKKGKTATKTVTSKGKKKK